MQKDQDVKIFLVQFIEQMENKQGGRDEVDFWRNFSVGRVYHLSSKPRQVILILLSASQHLGSKWRLQWIWNFFTCKQLLGQTVIKILSI